MVDRLKLRRVIKLSFLFLLVTSFFSVVATRAKSQAEAVCYVERRNEEMTNLDHLCQQPQPSQQLQPSTPSDTARSNWIPIQASQAEREQLLQLLRSDRDSGISYLITILCRQQGYSAENCPIDSSQIFIKEY